MGALAGNRQGHPARSNGAGVKGVACRRVKDRVLTTVVAEEWPGKGTTVKGKVAAIDDESQLVEMEGAAEVKKTRVNE